MGKVVVQEAVGAGWFQARLYGPHIRLAATSRAFPLANAKLAAIINRGAFIGVWVRAISVA